jgi:hypothetical protein
MDNFINAGIIAIIYLLIKFAEMRLLLKETKPVRDLIRDMVIVYISVFVGMYVIQEMVTSGLKTVEVASAFTDTPGF